METDGQRQCSASTSSPLSYERITTISQRRGLVAGSSACMSGGGDDEVGGGGGGGGGGGVDDGTPCASMPADNNSNGDVGTPTSDLAMADLKSVLEDSYCGERIAYNFAN